MGVAICGNCGREVKDPELHNWKDGTCYCARCVGSKDIVTTYEKWEVKSVTGELSPCIRCGYCCTEQVCPFGERIGDKCLHLIFEGEIATCRIKDWIVEQPGADISPGFGKGCSMITSFHEGQ